ncbi:mandelate racemase/muconate lactonizing enzyme family protein [Chloroflexota bacterium]
MKINSVEVIALKPTESAATRPIVCRVNTDEGIYGYGEAGVAIISGALSAYNLIKDLSQLILGMDPLHHEVIWEKLFKQSFWAQGNGAIEMAAISALDTALWDIKGKYYQAPLHELLGGQQRSRLRAYASQLQFGWNVAQFTPLAEVSEYKDTCQKAIAEGYDAIKVNFLMFNKNRARVSYLDATGHLSREVMHTAEERLAVTRETVGPDVDIILENHAMTDAATAIQFGQMAQKYDIMFMEEPATPLNPQVMKKIADKVTIPLATGERTYTRWGFLPFLENGSIAVIQPDIGNCGGITECKKICDMAHVYDVSVQTHVCSSPISVAVSLQLEAAIPNFVIHEHHIINTTASNIEMGKYNYQPIKGYFDIPSLPGIGQELSDYALNTAEIETVN